MERTGSASRGFAAAPQALTAAVRHRRILVAHPLQTTRARQNSIISNSGYTDAAVLQCKDFLAHRLVVLCHLEETVRVLYSLVGAIAHSTSDTLVSRDEDWLT